jgi:hypothetical protein
MSVGRRPHRAPPADAHTTWHVPVPALTSPDSPCTLVYTRPLSFRAPRNVPLKVPTCIAFDRHSSAGCPIRSSSVPCGLLIPSPSPLIRLFVCGFFSLSMPCLPRAFLACVSAGIRARQAHPPPSPRCDFPGRPSAASPELYPGSFLTRSTDAACNRRLPILSVSAHCCQLVAVQAHEIAACEEP